MTQITAYATTLPTNYLVGPAVLYIDSATPYGVSVGGITINLPHEYENVGFDGKLTPIVGLDRRVGGVPSFEATFCEMTAAKALDLEPGGTSASAGSIDTITPKPFNEFLVAADYKESVRVAIRRGGATNAIFLVEFNWGLLHCETIETDKDGLVKVRFEARSGASDTIGVAPYLIKLAADMATIQAADP